MQIKESIYPIFVTHHTHPLEFTFFHQINIDRHDKKKILEAKHNHTQEFNLLRVYQTLIPIEK